MGENSAGYILPPVQNLIIDEAHQLQLVAERQLSQIISQKALDRILRGLWQRGKWNDIIADLAKLPQADVAKERLIQLQQLAAEAKAAATEFFQQSNDILFVARQGHQKQVRILEQRSSEEWEKIENSLSNFIVILRQLQQLLLNLTADFQELEDPFFSIDMIGSYKIVENQLKEYVQAAQNIIDNALPNDLECVIWLEKNKPYELPSWVICPLEISML